MPVETRAQAAKMENTSETNHGYAAQMDARDEKMNATVEVMNEKMTSKKMT